MYDGQEDGRHLCGLIDVDKLHQETIYDDSKLGVTVCKLEQECHKSVPSQAQVTPKLGPS
jgi:hypothetical protein